MAGDFRFGVVGAFSGSRAGSRPDPVQEVDRDDFDALFARIAPRLSLGLEFCAELELDAWEQLHPEQLVNRVPALAALLEAHGAVEDPARVRALLGETDISERRLELEPPPDFGRSVQALQRPPSGASSEARLLDEILGGLSRGYVRRARAADPELARILDEVASPHAQRVDHAGIRARRNAIEALLGERLRAILHHAEFRRLEASWRSLRQLVHSSETSEALRIYAIDLPVAGDAALPALQRIVEEAARADAGFVLVVDREVDASDEDLAFLAALARIAGAGRVPCLLGAGRSLWEPASEKATSFLARARGLPGAERIALCGPRLLLRLPYGKAGEPVERFAFEEVATDAGTQGLCWGNGAFALAQALLDSVAVAGTPSAGPRFALREGLPVHAAGPGSPAGPTERALSESEVGKLRELGLLPLAAIRGRDALLVTSFRSLTGAPLFPG